MIIITKTSNILKLKYNKLFISLFSFLHFTSLKQINNFTLKQLIFTQTIKCKIFLILSNVHSFHVILMHNSIYYTYK